MEDTIVAISTSLGVGAIAIVRLSGSNAIEIVNNIFKGKDLTKVNSHTINYGYIKDKEEIIDEVLVSVMKAPKTFTKEDVIEINCHGGIMSTNKILEVILQHGARLASPGEFTKRAFLNGRIDLLESEAVMDIIESKSEKAREMALSNLAGKTSSLINEYREQLKDLLARIEVNIDYPEYNDIEQMTKLKMQEVLTQLEKELKNLIKISQDKEIIKEGIKTVIVGRPNVGKSSILNNFLEKDKAIVTSVAGTTRDIVEGNAYIDGVLFNIVDTAGIRETNDIVEQIGVKKATESIKDADLVLVVLNNNEKLTKKDEELLESVKNKKVIIVINKSDLKSKIDLTKIKYDNIVNTTATSTTGINELKNRIKTMFNLENIETKDYTYLTNARTISLAKNAHQNIIDAQTSLNNDLPLDIVEINIKEAFTYLGDIIGKNYDEEVLDHLFHKFCVGK